MVRASSGQKQWASSGSDVLVRLDPDEPLGAQLQHQLRCAIRAGDLAGGERLPSSRQLAADLGISRGVVVDAYDQLAAEGYVTSRPGAPTFVADCQCVAAEKSSPTPTPAAAPLSVDFAYGVPDLQLFPGRDWLWAVGEAVRNAPLTVLSNEDRRGIFHLRDVIADYARRVRGTTATPNDIVICHGFTQGLALTVMALARRGIDAIATEDPRHEGSVATIEYIGSHSVAVPVDDDGIDVEALRRSGARAVVVTPAHQAPSGVVLAPHRRQQLIAWANDVDGFVIEDDYDAEFRYDRAPVGAVQGLAPDRVVAIGTVSKALAPAIRLGWMVCPPSLAAELAAGKQSADHGTNGVDQYALAELIRTGRYDRHLRKARAVYAERRNALVHAVAEHAPGVRVSGLAAGFHAVVELTAGRTEAAVVAAAAARGVGVDGMSRWRADGSSEPARLVVGFGNLTPSSIRRGIELIADLL